MKKKLDILFILYMAALLWITVLRTGPHWNAIGQDGTLNLTLFEAYIPLFQEHRWWRIIYLLIGNIIWFVPFGVYMRCRGCKLPRIAVYGFLLSLFIEIMQYIFGTGISEIDDLILNTLGSILGGIGVLLMEKFRSRRKGNNGFITDKEI